MTINRDFERFIIKNMGLTKKQAAEEIRLAKAWSEGFSRGWDAAMKQCATPKPKRTNGQAQKE